MPQQVKAFGQILQFPDGMSEDEMAAAIRANEADLNPDYKAPLKGTLNSLAKKHLGVDFTSTPSIADQAEASATEGENTAARQVPGAPVRQSTYNKALLDPQQSTGGTDIASRIADAAGNDFKGQANQQELELLRTEALKPSESGFVSSALNSAGRTIKGAGQIGSDFLNADKDNAITQYGQKLLDDNPVWAKSLGDIRDEPFVAFKEASGNSVPSMGAMVAVGTLGAGITSLAPLTGPAAPVVAAVGTAVQWLGPAAVAALPSYSGIRDAQILKDPKNEADAKSKAIAALGASVVGAIEVAFGPQQWAIAMLTKEGRSAMARKFASTSVGEAAIKGALKGGLVEGTGEIVQSPIEQLASYENPTTDESIQDTLFSGAMGVLGGTGPGAVTGAVSQVKFKSIADAPTVDDAIKAATESVIQPVDPTLEDIKNETQKTTVDTRQPQASEVLDIVLPDNSSVRAQWAVVDADQLAASIKEDVNQPRDRTRAASDVQIKSIANAPDYRRLSDSPVMDVGAPVVDSDGRIVAGNGRFEGLTQAYNQGTANEYLAQLQEDAARKGLSIEGIAKPVLVRQLIEPVDTRKLAIASNSGGSLQYSALEQAKLDSERMKGIENLEVNDLGDIALTPRNATQLKDTLGGYTTAELGSLVDKSGRLSQEGVKRVRNAMLAKAYGSSPVLEKLIESTDSDMRNVLGALTKSAAHVISTKGDTKALLDAVDTYAQLKATGQPVDNFLAQQDAFSEGLSNEAADILRFIEANARSQKKLTDFFKGNFREVDTTSADMFEQPTKEQQLEKHLKENGYDFNVKPASVRDIDALDSTKKARKELAEKAARLFKKQVVFVKADGPFGINGVMVPGIADTIFVDIRTAKPYDAVMAHELSHWMEVEKPDVYKQLVKSLRKVIKDDATEGYAKKYEIEGASKSELTKEIVGDIMGDNFTNQSFWDKVAEANPKAFKDIAAAIIKWLKGVITKAKANDMGSEEWVTDATKARDILAKAVAEYTVDETTLATAKGNPKFSNILKIKNIPKVIKNSNDARIVAEFIVDLAKKSDVEYDYTDSKAFGSQYITLYSNSGKDLSIRISDHSAKGFRGSDKEVDIYIGPGGTDVHEALSAVLKEYSMVPDNTVDSGFISERSNKADSIEREIIKLSINSKNIHLSDYTNDLESIRGASNKSQLSKIEGELRNKLAKAVDEYTVDETSPTAAKGEVKFNVTGDNKSDIDKARVILNRLSDLRAKLNDKKDIETFREFGERSVEAKDILASMLESGRLNGIGADGKWLISRNTTSNNPWRVTDFGAKDGQPFSHTEYKTAKQALSDNNLIIDKSKIALFSRAYHGSPHDHNKFDSSKIGSGEGAQAYGYGHYFTDTKEVAEYYKNALSQGKVNVKLNGRRRVGDLIYFISERLVRSNGSATKQGVIDNIERSINKLSNSIDPIDKANLNEHRRALKQLQNSNQFSVETDGVPGRLYEVELAPEQDEYLLWDKPLSEQSDKVKTAISNLANSKSWDYLVDQQLGGDVYEQATGRDLYKAIQKTELSDKKASEYLHSLGIRGIKYLDGSSRAKGEGAYNYVIFDDNDVSITAKFSRQQTLPDTMTIDGVERPTTNSNGKPIHPTEEGIRNFWRWFGDDANVDDRGRPKVLYHSTLEDVSEFNPIGKFMGYSGTSGISLTDSKEMASRYLDRFAEYGFVNGVPNQPFNKNVMPVYAKIGKFIKRNEPFKSDIKFGAPLPKNYVPAHVKLGYDTVIRDDSINRKGATVKHSDAKNALRGKEYIIANPNQIKSAIGNNGDYSKDNNDIRFSRAPKLYSKLEQALEAANDKVFSTGPQVKLWLQSNASKLGIKKDEIYWSGIDNWLDAQGKVSKQQVVEFVRNNGVKVEDVTLGGDNEFNTIRDKLDRMLLDELSDKPVDKEERSSLEKRLREIKNTEPKHNNDKLTLPGGTDYKELVVTVPTVEKYNESDTTHFGDTGQGKHIGWVRMNTRNGGLFIEELQSQRAQQGRSKGFNPPVTSKDIDELNRLRRERRAAFFEMKKHVDDKGETVFDELNRKHKELGYEIDALERKMYGGQLVPPAPFVSDANNKATNAYITLLMKKALIEAVGNDHASVSWTTGDQQADRYYLSKQVDTIAYLFSKDKSTVTIQATKDNSFVYGKNNLPVEELADNFGKDIAKKITNDEGETNYQTGYKELSGLDLKTGGEWAQSMYGNEQGLNLQGKPSLMSQAANDIFKHVGSGKVESINGQPGFRITPEMRSKDLPLFSRADTVIVDGVERPTTNSEGKPINNPVNFWKWFGDSEARQWPTSSRGDRAMAPPLVFYHGTKGDFNEFVVGSPGVNSTVFGPWETKRAGMFFTQDKKFAESFATQGDSTQNANVIPVYLKVENAIDLTDGFTDDAVIDALADKGVNPRLMRNISADQIWGMFDEEDDGSFFVNKLKELGYDGAIIVEPNTAADDSVESWVVFNPNQIKSAIGNTGDYSKDNNDIRFSKADTPPEETRFRRFQRMNQDDFNRFTVIKEWLADNGVNLSDMADVYAAQERYQAMAANQLEDFRNKVRNPLIEKISKAGYTMDDIELFLKMQHAQEANAANRKLTGDPMSTANGIPDDEAADYLAEAPKLLGKLANEFRDITEQTKKLRLDAGILNTDITDGWESAYKYYIPLKGEADSTRGVGKGLKVNFKSKRRLGHSLRDEHVIENILMDHERAILEVERNRVGKHLVMMAAEMQRPDILSIGQPEKRKVLKTDTAYTVEANGVVQGVFKSRDEAKMFKQLYVTSMPKVAPSAIVISQTQDLRVIASASPMLADNEVNVYMNGHAIRVQINDELLARAYTKLGVEQFSDIVAAGRILNGYLSKVYTGYNPEFILTNMIRDFSSGTINLTGEQGFGMATKALTNYPRMFGDLLKYAATNGKQSTKWIDSYRANGGNTGAAYLSDMERLGNEVSTEYASYQGVMANIKQGDTANAARAAGRKVFNATLKWIYNLNQAGENAMRLAAFKAMIDSGRTVNEAAKVAKNITVNFNRKGERQWAPALYLFYNASIQGTAATAHALTKGKHRGQAWALAGSMAAVGYLVASAFGGGSEDDWDEINEYTKERNMLIKAGDGYVKVPVPYGYGFFWNLGRHMAEAQRTGEWGKLPWHLAKSAIEEFTPFGDVIAGVQEEFRSDQVFMGFMPTALKIPAQPIFNKQLFSGNELMPESQFDKSQPDRQKMFRTTKGTMYDEVAGWLEHAGFDVSPETLKYATRTGTGGAGFFVDTSISAAMLKSEGAELDIQEIPFVRKFYMELGIKDKRAAYYKAREEARTAAEEFNRARRANDIGKMRTVAEDKRELLALDRYANKLAAAIDAARDQQDAVRADENLSVKEKRLKLKNMEAQEAKFYDQYLDVFKAAKRQP